MYFLLWRNLFGRSAIRQSELLFFNKQRTRERVAFVLTHLCNQIT